MSGEMQLPEKRALRNGVVVRLPQSLGEAVRTIPSITAIAQALPPLCGLFVICDAKLVPIFNLVPAVGRIVPLPENGWTFEGLKELRSLRPGAAVIFRGNWVDKALFKLVGIRKIFDFSFPLNAPELGFGQVRQCRAWCGKTSALLGGISVPEIFPVLESGDFFPPDSVAGKFSIHPKILLMTPGFARKREEYEPFAAAALHWIENGGIVLLIGQETDRRFNSALLGQLPSRRAFDLTSAMELPELLYLMRYARGVLAGAGGIVQLANLTRCAGVALADSQEFTKVAPVGSDWEVIYPPTGSGAPRNQVPDVLSALDRMLGKTGTEQL
ncbi:MAG: hypothetical protein PHS41_12070 [Victivallaceae bacterium]|nr:hypothetical protein [Victivallaceae bacterium]